MAYHRDSNIITGSQHCMRCDKEIRLVNQSSNGPDFRVHSKERYGFQCIICGQVTCFECSDNRFRCNCGGNSWFACTYLQDAAAEIATIPFNH